jgi:hypothetical protein
MTTNLTTMTTNHFSELDDLLDKWPTDTTGMKTDEIEAFLDKWLGEIKDSTNAIRNNPNADLTALAAHADRWDAIRTSTFLLRSKVWRAWADAKAALEDEMRLEMTKRSRRQNDFSAWEERKAAYETKNLVYLQELRKFERVKTQLDDLLRFLAAKEKWLDAKRFNAHHDEKKEMHYSARENLIVD